MRQNGQPTGDAVLRSLEGRCFFLAVFRDGAYYSWQPAGNAEASGSLMPTSAGLSDMA